MRTKIMELRIKAGLTRDKITSDLKLDEREYEMMELGIVNVSRELEDKIQSYLKMKGA